VEWPFPVVGMESCHGVFLLSVAQQNIWFIAQTIFKTVFISAKILF